MNCQVTTKNNFLDDHLKVGVSFKISATLETAERSAVSRAICKFHKIVLLSSYYSFIIF